MEKRTLKQLEVALKTVTSSRAPLVFLYALLVFLLAAPGTALAAGDDVVWLTNGGRVRGQVMTDDADGVSVHLADGSVRHVPRAQIVRVAYTSDAAASSGVVASSADAPAELPRRSRGLMISGIVLMPAGVLFAGAGVVLAVGGHKSGELRSPSFCEGYSGGYPCGSEDNHAMVTAGTAFMVTGGILLATGLVFTLVGSARVSPLTPAHETMPAISVAFGLQTLSLVGTF